MKQERWINRYILALLLIFSIAIVVSSCGGGGNSGSGGGGNSSGSGGGGLATGTFTKTLGLDNDGGNAYPFHGSEDQKVQLLYTAAEINGSGNIRSLRFRRGSDLDTAQQTCPNTTIRLGHTSLTALTTTFGANVEQRKGSLATVLNNATVTISAGSIGDWFEIPLATTFNYNGVDNLVVEIERTTECSATVMTTYYAVASNRRAHSTAPDTNPGVAQHNQTTGSVDTFLNWIQFVFSGGDDTVMPTAGIVGSNSFPFNTNPSLGRKIQLLYPASAINGSGPITGIGMIVNATTSVQEYTMTVRMGHSTLTDLTATYNNNFSDTPVTVANGVVFKVPAGVPAGSTVWFPLAGTFIYNGTSNLIVEIDVTNNSSATGNISWRTNFPIVNNARVYSNTGVVTGAVDQVGYHIKFRFYGGTMDILNGGTSGEAAYFDSSNNGRAQYLLLASELGASGNITSFACRINNPNATALNYTNTMVILAHTANKSLSSTFASNLAGGVSVFSGTYTMPGNILEGDYFKIPFSTPFAYNGRDNLVVSIQSDADAAGITGVNCKLATDAVRFADQSLGTINYANAVGALSNYKPNVSITYSK